MKGFEKNGIHMSNPLASVKTDRYYLPLFIFILADTSVLIAALLFAYAIRFYTPLYEWVPPPPPPYIPDFLAYFQLALIITLISLFVFERLGLYQRRVALDRYVRTGTLSIAVLVTYIFIMALLFNYRDFSFSRLTVGMAIPITCAGLICARHALKAMQFYMIQNGIGFRKTLLAGPYAQCREVLQKLHEHHGSQYQVMGYAGPAGPAGTEDIHLERLGPLTSLRSILAKYPIDHVIIAMQPGEHREAVSVMEACRRSNTTFHVIPEMYDALGRTLKIEEIDEIPSIVFGETPLYGLRQVIKRTMDIVISSVALIAASPLMLLIALLIRLDSKGAIFYVQERIGNDGRKFKIYKFRSMIDDAERDSGPVWAKANDPRTTLTGRILRRYNLDELPQFLNVLRGDMSLVGPRPERPYFVDRFKEEIPLYMRRHMVKSGITGWAQVHGLRGDTSVVERTEYDLYYVKNWSVFLDIKIMWKTLTSFKNAY